MATSHTVRAPDGWLWAWRWPAGVLACAILIVALLMPLFTAIDVVPTPWLVYGFVAQAMFNARLALQWAQSERRHKSVVTASFWWWSVVGSLMLGLYFAVRGDPVAYLGQAFGTLVYVRNLWLLEAGRRWAAAALSLMLGGTVVAYLRVPPHLAGGHPLPALWLAFGFGAQALFTARMLVQWVASERVHASIVPVAFWWLSIAGGMTLGVYFLRRGEPVGFIGQLFGVVVAARNLWLMRANHECVVVAERSDGDDDAVDAERIAVRGHSAAVRSDRPSLATRP